MKTRALLMVLSCLYVSTTYSQQLGIRGTVVDENLMKGIEFVTIKLQNSDSTVVTGCYTKPDGTFEIDHVKIGTYILCASFVGYTPQYMEINVETSKNIGNIVLKENKSMLKEIVVEGKRSFVQQKIDRYVVNVSDHLLTVGRNGLDILKYTPGLLIQNKNISIMGDNVDVWVDGRPSHMDGNVLTTYLESLQGENIDQIEVITNPSSKFDSGGGRSIINIKIKKNRNVDVMNGSLNAGYELSKRNKGFGGVGLNYRTEKVNIYGSYNIRGGNDVSSTNETTTNTLETSKRIYDKSVEFDVYRTISNNYRMGIDLFPNKKNIVGFLFNGFNNNDNVNPNSKTSIDPSLNNTSLSIMDGKYNTNLDGQMYNMNYKHMFDKQGVELNVDVDYGHIENKQNQTQNYTFFSPTGNKSEIPSSQRSVLPQITNLWSANIDYQHPVSESLYWETGVKAGKSKTDNNIVYEELAGSNWVNVANRSNYFKYTENVYAAYANGGQRFKKWGYQIGLRAEYTYSKGNQIATNQKNENNYLRLFPSMFLQYMINANHNLGISYTRRIRRPNYQILNPFEIALDNYSYIAGNPYLKPSYNNNIELKYTFKQKLSSTISWVHNEKMSLLEPQIDETNNRYGYVYNNFGSRTAYICMINYNDNLFKFWRLSFMGQLAYIENKSNGSGANLNNDGLSGAIWINNNFQINSSLSVEVSLLMLPAMRIGYTKNDKLNNNLSLNIRKNIMSDKATISLSVNDLLRGQRTHNITDLNNIYIDSREDNNQQSIALSFSYRFGSDKVKGSRNRSIGIEEGVERSQNAEK
jgi:hypothetical protein